MSKIPVKAKIFARGPSTGTKVLIVDRDTFNTVCQDSGVEFEAKQDDSILATGALIFGTQQSGKYYIVLDRASSEFDKAMKDLTHECQVLQRLSLPSIGAFREKADVAVRLYMQHRKALRKIPAWDSVDSAKIDEVNETGEQYTRHIQEMRDCLNKMWTELKRSNPEANQPIKQATAKTANVLDIIRKYRNRHAMIGKELRNIFKKNKRTKKC